jgi:hypothetical protein
MLSIHHEGKKVVLAADRVEAGRKVDLPSRLERYFGRPLGLEYDGLRYIDYYAQYYLVCEERSENCRSDRCIPRAYLHLRKAPVICVINAVSIRDEELYALRLLLRIYPARSWGDLRLHDGCLFASFQAAVRHLGLVQNTDDEARLSMRDAIALGRPPSDLRFLFT